MSIEERIKVIKKRVEEIAKADQGLQRKLTSFENALFNDIVKNAPF